MIKVSDDGVESHGLQTDTTPWIEIIQDLRRLLAAAPPEQIAFAMIANRDLASYLSSSRNAYVHTVDRVRNGHIPSPCNTTVCGSSRLNMWISFDAPA